MTEYIKTEPAIKAIPTGRPHFNFESKTREDLPQFVTGGGYEEYCRELTII